jgi:antitoxin component YwqK of YwqJK toxin-antitoxin module
MNGVFKVTLENLLRESFSVEDGLLFRAYQTYHPNGSLATESNYLRGSKNGTEKFFYPSGTLNTQNPYSNGEKIKASMRYYEDGSLQSRTDKMGNTEYFHPNGTVYSQSTNDQNKIFKDGTLSFEEYEHEHKTGLISVVKS